MGTTLNHSLGIAMNSLQTTQTALSTISHNISNVNTPGFTRQQVISSSVALGGFGGGVEVGEIRQITNRFLQDRVNEQLSAVGYNNAKSTFMDNLEVIFGTPGAATSFEKVLGGFFNDLSNLANSPDSTSLQLNAVKNAEFVVDSLHNIASEIQAAQTRADAQIDAAITEVNAAIKKIHNLNREIISLGATSQGGQNTNDLVDERQRQVDILAKHFNITAITDNQGRVSVSTQTGQNLVSGSYVQLERGPATPPSSFQSIHTRSIDESGSPKSASYPVPMERMTGGAMKALVDIRDTEMTNLLAEVNNLTTHVIDTFNNIHSQGTSVPPLNQLTSGNGHKLSNIGADITSELNINVGDSFDISIVDIATGTPVSTTLTAGGGTASITVAASPATLTDIANAINTNPDIGGDVTASVILDAQGNEQLQITANNSNYGVVLANNVGNIIGELGMNNFFTGSDATDVAIREDIVADPARIATARMRDSDGGLSFLDNRNIIELAQLSETDVSFSAAGNLAAGNSTLTEYFINISSNLATRLQETTRAGEYAQTVLTDMETRLSSVSGVNIDEELSNLLTFQRSYQASARIITMVDEMLETLVNII